MYSWSKMQVYPDTDMNSLFLSLPDYAKQELVSKNRELFQLTEEQTKEKLFNAPPTEPEILKAFQETGVLGYVEGHVGTVYASNDDDTITVVTVTIQSYRGLVFPCHLSYKTIDVVDLHLPSLEGKNFDLKTRYLVKCARDPQTDRPRSAFIRDWDTIVPPNTGEGALMFAVSARAFRAYNGDYLFLNEEYVSDIQALIKLQMDIDPERGELHYRYFDWFMIDWNFGDVMAHVIRDWLRDQVIKLCVPITECLDSIVWNTDLEDPDDVVDDVNSTIEKCGYKVLCEFDPGVTWFLKLVKL